MVFAIHWHESAMGVHVSPTLNAPSHLPPHHYPSGLSQCTSVECPVSCTELGLMIYFTYGNIHVSCYSLKSSHPRLLPQRPKVCSLYLCLFCCLAYRVIVNDLSKFHIYTLNMFLDRTTVWKERKKGQELGRSGHLTTLATCFVSCYCWIVFSIKVKFYDIFKISYHTSITAFILAVHSALFLSRWIIYDDNQRLSSVCSFMLFFGRRQSLPWERNRQGPRWG